MATADNHPRRREGGGSGDRGSTPLQSGADTPANRRVPDATITLSNTSVFPQNVDSACKFAKKLGFGWQRDYADRFVEVLADMQGQTDIRFAVENMFPRRLLRHRPHWNLDGPRWATLDVSHAAASGSDVLAMAGDLGERLTHVHFADSETNRDEHLVPGRGDQPCGMLLEQLAEGGSLRAATTATSASRSTPAPSARRSACGAWPSHSPSSKGTGLHLGESRVSPVRGTDYRTPGRTALNRPTGSFPCRSSP